MKSPFTKVGIAAVLAAGLILAPGLSPAQADAPVLNVPAASKAKIPGDVLAPGLSLGNPALGGAGGTATTYGLWFVPCDFLGFRLC